MNTRIVMALSAAFLALVGLSFTFMPQELLGLFGASALQPVPLLMQLGGGALVGWAMVNWTARGLVVGGIYSRPLTLGNLVHFLSVSLALSKAVFVVGPHPLLLAALVGYGSFGACFGYLVFGHGAACVQASSHGPAA
jgi:hypothetical protein